MSAHSELLQFDWRALSVLGSSTFSKAAPTSVDGSTGDQQTGGVPIVQLKLDVASKRLTSSSMLATGIFEDVLATSPLPVPREDGTQLVYPTHSLICELDAATLDEAITALHAAIVAATAGSTS